MTGKIHTKWIVFSVVLFIMGFLGGYGFTVQKKNSGEHITKPIEAREQVRRSSASWEKKIKTMVNSAPKRFTEKDLRALKTWLAKGPTSAHVEERLVHLLQYPFKKGDPELYLAMQHLFSYWGRLEPRKALDSALALSGSWITIKKDIVSTALVSHIENNPSDVAAWLADRNTNLYLYPEIIPVLSLSLTQKSPDDAWKWLASLPYVEQSKAFSPFFEEIFKSHPERLKEFINQLEPPENWGESFLMGVEDQRKVSTLVRLYARLDYDAAAAWLDTFPDNLKKEGYLPLLATKAEKDPVEALHLLNSIPENKLFILGEIASVVLASNDPVKIESWFQALAKGEPHVTAPGYNFIRFMNPVDAANMLNKLPAGMVKDSLISNFITYNLTDDEQKAVQLFEQIQDPFLKKVSAESLEKNKNRKTDKNL